MLSNRQSYLFPLFLSKNTVTSIFVCFIILWPFKWEWYWSRVIAQHFSKRKKMLKWQDKPIYSVTQFFKAKNKLLCRWAWFVRNAWHYSFIKFSGTVPSYVRFIWISLHRIKEFEIWLAIKCDILKTIPRIPKGPSL